MRLQLSWYSEVETNVYKSSPHLRLRKVPWGHIQSENTQNRVPRTAGTCQAASLCPWLPAAVVRASDRSTFMQLMPQCTHKMRIYSGTCQTESTTKLRLTSDRSGQDYKTGYKMIFPHTGKHAVMNNPNKITLHRIKLLSAYTNMTWLIGWEQPF